MASPDEIRAIRELQRQTEGPLSYQDAQRASQAQPARDFTKVNVAKLFDLNGKLRAELDALKQSLEGMRIIGEGFAGQGPRGIMFTAQPWIVPVLDFAVANLGSGEGQVLSTVALVGQLWTINARTILAGTNVTVTQETDTVTINATGIPDQTITINNDDPDVEITGSVTAGLITLDFVWTTDTCD
jgi:hypothetical protein